MARCSVGMPPSGNSLGWRSAYDIKEFSLGPNTSPLPSGTLTRSRGTDAMEMVRPTGSSDTTIIVSVSVAGRHGRASTPRSRMLTRSSRSGPLGVRGADLTGNTSVVEDACERVAEGRAVAMDDDVGQDDRRDDDGEAEEAETAGLPVPARVKERLEDADQSQGEQEQAQRQERVQRGRRSDHRRQPGGRLCHPCQRGEPQEQDGRDEEDGGKAASVVEQLTESGKDGRQEGRSQAAAVQGSGVRPDPASVHDGRRSSSVGRPRGSLPRQRTWGRRAIDQPASDRPASGPVTADAHPA